MEITEVDLMLFLPANLTTLAVSYSLAATPLFGPQHPTAHQLPGTEDLTSMKMELSEAMNSTATGFRSAA